MWTSDDQRKILFVSTLIIAFLAVAQSFPSADSFQHNAKIRRCPVAGKVSHNNEGDDYEVPHQLLKDLSSNSNSPSTTKRQYNSGNPLYNANQFLLNTGYPSALEDILEHVSFKPVILVYGKTYILLKNNQNETSRIVIDLYDNLKMTCHLALSTFLVAEPVVFPHEFTNPNESISANNDILERARTLLNLTREIIPSLPIYFTNSSQLARQERIVAETIAFLSELIDNQAISWSRTRQYTRLLAPLIDDNIRDGVRMYLNALHEKVMSWKSNMTAQEWDHLKVVVTTAPMARNLEMNSQYFARLLKTDLVSGERIMYAEHISNIQQLVQLLGVYTTDFKVGEAFFDDAQRMHSDVQAPDTLEYLPILLPDEEEEKTITTQSRSSSVPPTTATTTVVKSSSNTGPSVTQDNLGKPPSGTGTNTKQSSVNAGVFIAIVIVVNVVSALMFFFKGTNPNTI